MITYICGKVLVSATCPICGEKNILTANMGDIYPDIAGWSDEGTHICSHFFDITRSEARGQYHWTFGFRKEGGKEDGGTPNSI